MRRAKEEARELPPEVREYELLDNQLSLLCTRIAMAERELLALTQPDDAKDRLAFETAAKHVEKADKWLKNATQRRNTLLKILEYFCRLSDRETEITAVRYDHVQQDEVRKIAAPVVPPPAAIVNVTTEALNSIPVGAQQPR